MAEELTNYAMPKTRNIIIFVAIAAVFALIYFMFLRPEPEETANLISAPSQQAVTTGGASPAAGTSMPNTPLAANDFLTLLLNVKNIKLEDAIFADPAFQGLRDSSIILEPDGNEGRPNPFAPLGQDIMPPAVVVPIPKPEDGIEEEQLLDMLEGFDLGDEEDIGMEDNFAPTNHFDDPLTITSVTPLTGPVGTVVTIKGFGFSQYGNKVNFKSSPIQGLNSTDGTSLVFTIPSSVTPLGLTKPQAVGQGIYSFFVSNNKGKSTSTWQFTVTP